MAGSLSKSRSKPKGGPIRIEYPAKAKLFDLDRPPSRVYLLRSGHVRLTSGREAILDYLEPGSFFGEKCLLGSQRAGQVATQLGERGITNQPHGEALQVGIAFCEDSEAEELRLSKASPRSASCDGEKILRVSGAGAGTGRRHGVEVWAERPTG